MPRFAAERGVTYELLRDPELALADELGVVAYPVTLFVDADGTILERTGADRRRRAARAHRGALAYVVAVNLGLSFLRGMVAAVNPCGFVLLPTYLMYFLGLEAGARRLASGRRCAGPCSSRPRSRPGSWPCSSSSGRSARGSRRGSSSNSKYVTGVIGVVLVVLGIAMLFGYQLPLRHAAPRRRRPRPHRPVDVRLRHRLRRRPRSAARCRCSCRRSSRRRRDGVVAGVVNGAAFGLGMALLVTALTVTLAVANQALLRVLRSAMRTSTCSPAAFVAALGPLPRVLLLGRRRERGARTASRTPSSSFQTASSSSSTTTGSSSPSSSPPIVVGAIVYVVVRRRPPTEPPVASPGVTHQLDSPDVVPARPAATVVLRPRRRAVGCGGVRAAAHGARLVRRRDVRVPRRPGRRRRRRGRARAVLRRSRRRHRVGAARHRARRPRLLGRRRAGVLRGGRPAAGPPRDGAPPAARPRPTARPCTPASCRWTSCAAARPRARPRRRSATSPTG